MTLDRVLKDSSQAVVREGHVRFARKALPQRLAIYFHALERSDHDAFRRAVDSARSRGYSVVGSAQEWLMATGKTVWLSFDDNYISWHESLELFDELDVRATFFLNTEPLRGISSQETIDCYYQRIRYLSNTTPLSTSEVKDIAVAGHTIAAHTHRHHNLGEVTEQLAAEDLRQNVEIIQALTGEPVLDFAIPFGMRRHFNPRLEGLIAEIGISTISYGIPGMQYANTRGHHLHRTPWRFERSVEQNWQDLQVDGRLFERITGRSAVG